MMGMMQEMARPLGPDIASAFALLQKKMRA